VRARVLGSAAGGGFPQWNCACSGCQAARAGRAAPRTQDSVAVSADGDRWVLLNASPDVRAQLEGCPALLPREGRGSPVQAVVLTSADLDHTLGLFSLREAQPIALYATREVLAALTRSILLRTLQRSTGQLVMHELALSTATPLVGADGRSLGLTVTAVPVPGKLPPHLAGITEASAGDQVALTVRGASRALAYAPCVASVSDLAGAFADADALLFDGTFFTDGELAAMGGQSARAMAHLPISAGPAGPGSLAYLAGLGVPAFYTHINNTNPILLPGSDELAQVLATGVRVAEDGLEVFR
jgi:pyrroloquinoline quinone biosynthesis protein B